MDPVAVPKRAGRTFDIDLGTSSSGSTFAVYTRSGDIYRLNVATGVEAKVSRLSSPKVERSPTIQHGRIAFIRRNGRFDELRVGTATTASHVLLRGASILSAELGERHVAYVTAGSGGMRGESQMQETPARWRGLAARLGAGAAIADRQPAGERGASRAARYR